MIFQMRLPLLAALLVALLLAPLAVIAQTDQSTGKTYTYALWTPNGKKTSTTNEFVKRLVELMFKAMGENVRFVYMSRDEAMKSVRAKKVDITYLWQSDYLSMLDAGVEVHPILTVTSRGHLKDNMCVVVAKDFPYTGVGDLRGKRYIVPQNFWDYVGFRWYLSSKGFNMPLDKFFGQMVSMSAESTDVVSAIADGKLDADIMADQTVNFFKFANASILKKIKMADCAEWPWPGAPVVWVGKIDPKFQKKFYDVLSRLQTLPEFQQLKPTLNLIKAQMNLVNEKDYAGMRKTYADAKKNGWIAEYNRIAGKK